MTKPAPNPGSPEAIALGCLCSADQNHDGEGYDGKPGVFLMDALCDLHMEAAA